VFQIRDHGLELLGCSPEEMAVNKAWITRTQLVAEGIALEPYIHLDIRTPFGESVDERQVDTALGEGLGPRKDKYARGGWHLQFVEDTNLGSNHRVFVDLHESSAPESFLSGMDSGLPLEVAMEALGDLLFHRRAEPNFQLLCGGPRFCYSLLYLNGAPFHVLRVDEGAGESAAERLLRHRDFALAQVKNGASGLKTFLPQGDPLGVLRSIQALKPETADFGTPLSAPAGSNGFAASLNLHLGLAHAARQREFAAHNRVPEDQRRRNAALRSRSRFFAAMGAMALICLLVAAGFWTAISLTQSRLHAMKIKAAGYQSQVDAIRASRRKKAALESSLENLRPLWAPPVPWGDVFSQLAGALPKEGGLDGLAVNRNADGTLALSFRAWVRDWDQVQAIEKRLTATRRFSSVSMSEQRKDLGTGVVVFHVTCRLERN
jgi:Tfp pilus assembly protein PilN